MGRVSNQSIGSFFCAARTLQEIVQVADLLLVALGSGLLVGRTLAGAGRLAAVLAWHLFALLLSEAARSRARARARRRVYAAPSGGEHEREETLHV